MVTKQIASIVKTVLKVSNIPILFIFVGMHKVVNLIIECIVSIVLLLLFFFRSHFGIHLKYQSLRLLLLSHVGKGAVRPRSAVINNSLLYLITRYLLTRLD